MRKIIFLVNILIVILVVTSCNKNINTLTDNDIVETFTKYGFGVELEDFPKSRSENIPAYLNVKILKIDDEEVFVFILKNENEVEEAIKKDFKNEQGLMCYKENVILLYRNDTKKLVEVMQNEFE